MKTKAKYEKLSGNNAYENTILQKVKIQSTKICNETEFIKNEYNSFLKDLKKYGDTIKLYLNFKYITENFQYK